MLVVLLRNKGIWFRRNWFYLYSILWILRAICHMLDCVTSKTGLCQERNFLCGTFSTSEGSAMKWRTCYWRVQTKNGLFSVFHDQLAKALFTLIPCIIFKSANFAFLAADVNQANKITIQSHHKCEKYPRSNKSSSI